MSRNGSESRNKSTDGRPLVSEDRIRLRAYEKFCRRGGAPCDAVGDWLEAERELHQQARVEGIRRSQGAALTR